MSPPPLALDKVRHVGEAVAMVAAESRYLAEDAIERIVVEYAPLPVVKDMESALEPASPVLHDEAGTNLLVRRGFVRGDGAAALAGGGPLVAGGFRFHPPPPACWGDPRGPPRHRAGRGRAPPRPPAPG